VRFTLIKIGFLPVTLMDVLDILIIWYIVYKIFQFIKGTRAVPMAIGLVIILLLSVVAPVFNLSAITWLFKNLRTIWLIAFVILFQPELRRMLMYLGQTRLVRFFVKVTGNRVVEEIVKAVIELRERGYGALIVMVRDTGVKTILETGVNIHAEVSVPLILSIFNPRSPLHDGAIVVQNEIISAAKCILPLSQNPHIDQELGTRHRAALGLAEESDAMVIVVSEETGKISIAMDGSFQRDLNYDSLRKVLIQGYQFSAES
jgi:diadenylate cyclase